MTASTSTALGTAKAMRRIAASIRSCGNGASLQNLDASWIEQAEKILLEVAADATRHET